MKFLRPLVKVILNIVLVHALLAALVYGWAWYHDRQNERTAREVIDPKAAAYLAEQYPGNDFEVGHAYHVFLDNCFRVKVQSQSSRDTHFWLEYPDETLELARDTYDSMVLSGINTLHRLVEEYDALITAALGRDVQVIFRTRDVGEELPVLDCTELLLDADYDLSELGALYGEITVTLTVSSEEFTPEYASEILPELDQQLTEQGVAYSTMRLELRIKSPLDSYSFPKLTPEQIRSSELADFLSSP